MKKRINYVSNSSSTSFCIVGVDFCDKDFSKDAGKLKEILLRNDFKEDKIDNEEDIWELLISFYRNKEDDYKNKNEYSDFTAHMGLEDYGAVVGIDIRCMGGDETMNQFKERVYNMLKDFGYVGPKEKIQICIDGGFEG